jgi:FkbM family methyltransferase
MQQLKKILIGIPTAKHIELDTFKSIYELEVPDGYETHFQYFVGYDIDHLRNSIAEYAINGFDYLFSVDSDISFPSDTLIRLLSHDMDIVSGLYIQRKPGQHTLEIYESNAHGGVSNVSYDKIKGKGLVEIAGCGFGCVLIKSEVMKTVGYPQFQYHSALNHMNTVSEDVDFCRKVRGHGFKIWADASILCLHSGTTIIRLDDYSDTLPSTISTDNKYVRTDVVDGISPWAAYDMFPTERSWEYIVAAWHEIKCNISLVTSDLGTVVHAGGWQGLYPRCLSDMFDTVYTFEPHPLNFSCLEINCNKDNIHIFNSALGNKVGKITLEEVGTTGQHRINDNPARPAFPMQVVNKISVEITTIDSLDLQSCSLILLNVQNYELQTLMGAENTINKFHPGIIVSVSFLESNNNDIHQWLIEHQYALTHSSNDNRYYKRSATFFKDAQDRLRNYGNESCLPVEHIDYLTNLHQTGYEPSVIYDIGANVLHWTNEAQQIWPNSTIVLFDAADNLEFLYKERQLSYSINTLSDTDGRAVDFFQNDCHPGGNSYYQENNAYSTAADRLFNESHRREVSTITLDTLVKNDGFPLPDMIKMDVQGAELDILKGASNTLKTVKHIILELQLAEYNKGAPLCDEVIEYMSSIDFELVDSFCFTGIQADYHFVRRVS